MDDCFPSPESRTFISQRLKLHYLDWGNPEARPLLMLHGGRDHCRSWDWMAREQRRDWHVITPDLRGHGDSAHSPDGHYSLDAYVYDLAQVVHQADLAPLDIVAHSLGGQIALRYTGLYPENVRRLVAIEGLGIAPRSTLERDNMPIDEKMRAWIEELRGISTRQTRRYSDIEQALRRMLEENPHLSVERARHLTRHGMNRNEDGSYSWKVDNCMRVMPPVDITPAQREELWRRIVWPSLLVYGGQSWASNPEDDGSAGHFRDARVSLYDDAGHWVQHDRHDDLLAELRDFLTGS